MVEVDQVRDHAHILLVYRYEYKEIDAPSGPFSVLSSTLPRPSDKDPWPAPVVHSPSLTGDRAPAE